MWIRKIYARCVTRWNDFCRSGRTELSAARAGLYALDPKLFTNYTVAKGCVFPVNVLYKDIETYNKRLKHANYLLTNKIAVANSWCRYEWAKTSLEDMWTTSKGIRTDPVTIVNEFKSLTLTFIDQYALIEDEQIDTDGHNARMLATFRTSVVQLANRLLHFTLS